MIASSIEMQKLLLIVDQIEECKRLIELGGLSHLRMGHSSHKARS